MSVNRKWRVIPLMISFSILFSTGCSGDYSDKISNTAMKQEYAIAEFKSAATENTGDFIVSPLVTLSHLGILSNNEDDKGKSNLLVNVAKEEGIDQINLDCSYLLKKLPEESVNTRIVLDSDFDTKGLFTSNCGNIYKADIGYKDSQRLISNTDIQINTDVNLCDTAGDTFSSISDIDNYLYDDAVDYFIDGTNETIVMQHLNIEDTMLLVIVPNGDIDEYIKNNIGASELNNLMNSRDMGNDTPKAVYIPRFSIQNSHCEAIENEGYAVNSEYLINFGISSPEVLSDNGNDSKAFVIDKPFIYAIIDNETNFPLLIGVTRKVG